MAFQQKKPAAIQTVDFMDDDFYSGGGGLPEGNYIWTDLVFRMHQATDRTTGANRGEARLTATIKMVPLEDPTAKEWEQNYSLGTKAHLSFQPNPNDGGKSLVAVPGGPASTANNSTNWYLLQKSMKDSLGGWPDDLPKGDLAVLEGSWVHMIPVDEPGDRSSFRSQTGEAAGQQNTKPMKVPVVSEFLEGGKPWEGGGGIPEAPAPVKAAAPKAAAKAPVKAAAKVVEPEPAEDVDEAIKALAISAASGVMAKNPAGIAKLKLRTETFKAVKASTKDDDMAQAVIANFFEDADGFENLLGEMMCELQGNNVVKL